MHAIAFPNEPFFRFRSFVPARPNEPREIICDSKLWFSSPNSFNDPFEAKPSFRFDQGGRLTREQLDTLYKRRFPHVPEKQRRILAKEARKRFRRPEDLRTHRSTMRNEISKSFNGTGLCCFFKEWNHHALWAYYADGHRGYCLVFDSAISWVVNNSHVGNLQLAPMDIRYQSEYPEVDLDWRQAGKDGWDVVETALLTKSLNWKHENEARIIVPECTAQNIAFPPSFLSMVILGIRAAPTDIDSVKKLAATRIHGKLPVLQVVQKIGTFELGLATLL